MAAVTVISTVPGVPAGTIAEMELSVMTLKLVAGLNPKSTAVASVKPLPVIVITFPPLMDPLDGLTEVITGAAIRGFAQITNKKHAIINLFKFIKLQTFYNNLVNEGCHW